LNCARRFSLRFLQARKSACLEIADLVPMKSAADAAAPTAPARFATPFSPAQAPFPKALQPAFAANAATARVRADECGTDDDTTLTTLSARDK